MTVRQTHTQRERDSGRQTDTDRQRDRRTDRQTFLYELMCTTDELEVVNVYKLKQQQS